MPIQTEHLQMYTRASIITQITIYRRIRVGRDGYLDRPEAYDIS